MNDIQYQRNWLGSSICFLAAKVADHWSSVRLKVTRKEQEKMQKVIEKQRETRSTSNAVTAMFYDRNVFLGVIYSFRARINTATSLSDDLTVGCSTVFQVSSLPWRLKGSFGRAYPRYRAPRRASLRIEKFSAEVLDACSARSVFGAILNKRGAKATANPFTKMTEQRCCAAA